MSKLHVILKNTLLISVLVCMAACIHNAPTPYRTGMESDTSTSRPSVPVEVNDNNKPQNKPKHLVNNVTKPKLLELDDIEYYLKNKVSCKLIASRILERGVNFELNEKSKKRLKKLKADERVFKAIQVVNIRKNRKSDSNTAKGS